jgi:hypothetical protein
VGGKDGQLFGTAVAVFALNIPNRYLPILQQGQGGRGRGGSSRGPRASEHMQIARSKLEAENPMKALTAK